MLLLPCWKVLPHCPFRLLAKFAKEFLKMQRILSLKLLSKTINRCKTNPIPLKISPDLSKTTTTSHPVRHFFSEHSTWSSSPSNRAFSDKISHGFCSNPVLAKYFLRHSTLKDLSRSLFNGNTGFSRVQISRRIFHSFDVTRHSAGSAFRRLTVNDVLLGLIITNVAVFWLWNVADWEFMKNNFMISVNNIKSGRVHTLITSAFSHMDVSHLIGNMFWLYFFGRHIGGVLGPEYLLKMYFAGALAGSVFFLLYIAFFASSVEVYHGCVKPFWTTEILRIGGHISFFAPATTSLTIHFGEFHGATNHFQKTEQAGLIPPEYMDWWMPSFLMWSVGKGASGATNAIMLLDILLFPKKTIYLLLFIPVPAMLMGIFVIGYDVLRVMKGDTYVSGSAHLGGMAVAALAWYQIRRGRFRF